MGAMWFAPGSMMIMIMLSFRVRFQWMWFLGTVSLTTLRHFLNPGGLRNVEFKHSPDNSSSNISATAIIKTCRWWVEIRYECSEINDKQWKYLWLVELDQSWCISTKWLYQQTTHTINKAEIKMAAYWQTHIYGTSGLVFHSRFGKTGRR